MKYFSDADFNEATDVYIKVVSEKEEDLKHKIAEEKQVEVASSASEITIDFGSGSVQRYFFIFFFFDTLTRLSFLQKFANLP